MRPCAHTVIPTFRNVSPNQSTSFPLSLTFGGGSFGRLALLLAFHQYSNHRPTARPTIQTRISNDVWSPARLLGISS